MRASLGASLSSLQRLDATLDPTAQLLNASVAVDTPAAGAVATFDPRVDDLASQTVRVRHLCECDLGE